jgi:hypothetical protein
MMAERATPEQSKALNVVKDLRASFRGFTGSGVAPTGRPTTPLFDSDPMRENCIVSAAATNTDPIYFSFNQDISTSEFTFLLNAGDSLTLMAFKGAIYCWSPVTGQSFGYGVW